MTEEQSDERETAVGGGSPGAGGTPPSFQEQQAIAAAMMIGEQMRRDDRSQAYFYTQRIALFISVLAFMAMIMLYTYARLSGGDFNPILGVVFLGLVMAGGASVSYWAHAESRRAKED
ncbi:MAG: hypothetical protein IID09_02575 [Candidatus Hydrogenedentes bacterium]|nr:hypothetical protein [Candidatus Hydrogenedentota bacterium]